MRTSSIRVLDVIDGKCSERASSTPTIDVPPDLDRSVGVVSVDRRSNGHHRGADGKDLTFSAFVRPLSWRAKGELFLLVDGRKDPEGTYRLSSIDSGERRADFDGVAS
jgi:hypothetical protein